jgi:putative hydrolase of the HAD superfamily
MRRYRLYDDVTAAIARIRRRIGALAVVTNGPADTQAEKLMATGLDGMVDLVVTSGELRIAKPDPRIFHVAVHRLGVRPREAWHVGDSLVSDIAGARRAELGAAVWINRTGQGERPEPTHTVVSLTELADLVDG